MNKVVRCLTVLFITFMLTGCGNGQKEGPVNGTGNTESGENEKVIVTYGYIDAYDFQDLQSNINERIVAFNRSQDKYYIEVIKYGEDNYQDGLNALNADVSAGKGPDIIEINDEMLLRRYGVKGIIEDLYSYMEQGEWPRREDFVDNVLSCFETEGKLYGLVPFFKILSAVGNPNYITSDKVTFAQLKEMYEKNKKNTDITVYNAFTRSFLADHCVMRSLDNFVDMENRSCNFVDSDFQELLEFSAQFGDGGWEDTFENYAKLQENKICLFYEGSIGGFQSYTHYRELLGEDVTLVGFPSISGSSPEIITNSPFLAINSKSKNKDAAWQFLCTFLDDNYLSNSENFSNNVGFPVTESGFEKYAQRAMMNHAVMDAEGNMVPGSGEGSYTNVRGETLTYPLYPTTEDEVAYIKKIIRNITPSKDYGEIPNIIWEEIENYWNGTKTVQQVMEVIQNRAQLYLEE